MECFLNINFLLLIVLVADVKILVFKTIIVFKFRKFLSLLSLVHKSV